MAQTFGPYMPVRRAGNLLFVSGQVGVDSTTKTADTDISQQTRQSLENLRRVLATAGAKLEQVVKTTIFLVDMNDFSKVNDEYIQFFDEPRPARSTVAVADLPHVAGDTKLLIEIEAVADLGSTK